MVVTVVPGLLHMDPIGFLLRTQHLPWSSSAKRPYLMEDNDLWISCRLLSVGDYLAANIQVGETL